MDRDNTYNISGIDFKLREPGDFDMDEQEFVEKFFENAYATDRNTIIQSTTADKKEKLFTIILEPCSELPEGFSFRKTKNTVAAQIIAGFFLTTVLSSIDMVNSLKNSMKKQMQP